MSEEDDGSWIDDIIRQKELKLISEFVEDLKKAPMNASHIESHETYMMQLLEKWEEKLK